MTQPKTQSKTDPPAQETALDVLKDIREFVRGVLIAVAGTDKPIAPDEQLDGKWGDPKVRMVPKQWTGADYKGRRMSECPSDLLVMYADTLEYFATVNEREGNVDAKGEPKAKFDRLDAAKARGWARRNRHKPAEPSRAVDTWDDAAALPHMEPPNDDDIPF